MSFYIEPKWEVDAQTGAFRKYCDVTQSLPTGIGGTNVYIKDSIVGAYRSFSTTATVAYIPQSATSASYMFPANFIPSVSIAKIYPTPIINQYGGWRYTPVDLGLPKTLSLPNDFNLGFLTDVKINITTTSSAYRRITIIDADFDTAWDTIYLAESQGDGGAVESTRIVNRVTYKLYGWRTYYRADWLSLHNINGSGGDQLIYGVSGGAITNPNQLADGDYLFSDLVAQGTASWSKTGYLTIGVGALNHYRVS